MKRILALLLGIQCSACAIGGGEQPPALFAIQSPGTSSIANQKDDGPVILPRRIAF
jgi:hypothetical protein